VNRLVIDIETLGYPLDYFDEHQQEYLLKFATTDDERTEAIQKFSLYPTTAQILAIGMLNPDTQHARILFQADKPYNQTSEDGTVEYIAESEQNILKKFWEDIPHYQQLITFNGRGFDFPFLMLRSAILNIKVTRNLMGNRYDTNSHCDLLEQFTFYGALRKFNLDFYCKIFSIQSPKAGGITGLDMKQLFEENRFKDIAEYNLGDLRATAELFRIWEQYLNVSSS
jgi:DNA polymerase elongation subunit (family B)